MLFMIIILLVSNLWLVFWHYLQVFLIYLLVISNILSWLKLLRMTDFLLIRGRFVFVVRKMKQISVVVLRKKAFKFLFSIQSILINLIFMLLAKEIQIIIISVDIIVKILCYFIPLVICRRLILATGTTAWLSMFLFVLIIFSPFVVINRTYILALNLIVHSDLFIRI